MSQFKDMKDRSSSSTSSRMSHRVYKNHVGDSNNYFRVIADSSTISTTVRAKKVVYHLSRIEHIPDFKIYKNEPSRKA